MDGGIAGVMGTIFLFEQAVYAYSRSYWVGRKKGRKEERKKGRKEGWFAKPQSIAET